MFNFLRTISVGSFFNKKEVQISFNRTERDPCYLNRIEVEDLNCDSIPIILNEIEKNNKSFINEIKQSLFDILNNEPEGIIKQTDYILINFRKAPATEIKLKSCYNKKNIDDTYYAFLINIDWN